MRPERLLGSLGPAVLGVHLAWRKLAWVVSALASRGTRLLASLLLALALGSGCVASHDSDTVPDVSPDKRMVELTGDEWSAFCDWRQSLRGDDPLLYRCVGDDPIEVYVSPGIFYDWTSSLCLDDVYGFRASWSIFAPDDCRTTVAEWAACWRTRARQVCFAAYEPSPECQQALDCTQ